VLQVQVLAEPPAFFATRGRAVPVGFQLVLEIKFYWLLIGRLCLESDNYALQCLRY